MRFVKRLLKLLILVLVLLIGVAFLLPASVHVERSIVIERPASEVFAVVNSFKLFNAWSPWAEKDPNAKYTFEGPRSGVGAKISWVGNEQVGSGNQTITESDSQQADKRVGNAIDFDEMGKVSADFFLSPVAKGSQVRWTMDMNLPMSFDQKFVSNLIGRYMGLFMDKLVGPDYERGLAKLKILLEGFPNVDITGMDGEPVALAAHKILFVSAHSSNDLAATSVTRAAAYTQIRSYALANKILLVDAPLTVTTKSDAVGWQFDAAIPVDRIDGAADEQVKSGTTYVGKAVQFWSVGAYEKLTDSTARAYAWLAVNGYQPADRLIEQYIDDPVSTPVEQVRTLIQIPVK
jgi:effector-binding domain-containing protein